MEEGKECQYCYDEAKGTIECEITLDIPIRGDRQWKQVRKWIHIPVCKQHYFRPPPHVKVAKK